jgi:hypothetical protein
MNQKQLWRDFAALPPEAQRQVKDFMDLLKAKYTQEASVSEPNKSDLLDEAFIGLWKDREAMQDSTSWVQISRALEANRSMLYD